MLPRCASFVIPSPQWGTTILFYFIFPKEIGLLLTTKFAAVGL